MVVNCLPLYEPPDEEARASATADNEQGGQRSSSHRGGRSTLIKARSMESISSSQLGDEETEQVVGDAATPPRRKSSKFAHYSVTVHTSSSVSRAAVEEEQALTSKDATQRTTSDSVTTEPSTSNGPSAISGDTEPPASSGDTEPPANDGHVQPSPPSAPPQSSGDVASIREGGAELANANGEGTKESDRNQEEGSEAGETEIVALEKKPDLEQPESQPAIVQEGESDAVSGSNERETEECGVGSNGQIGEGAVGDSEVLGESEEVKQKPQRRESEHRDHSRLQKTRSMRQSLSPEGDGSDSEEHGFSVNYVQDPHVLPELKRSSGSVSFFTPTANAGAGSKSTVKEMLLEMSDENRLDDEPEEKDEKATTEEVAGQAGAEATSREKSLSTAKPPLIEETDSILQKSASTTPTAPAQTSAPPTTSPPYLGGATAQAPLLNRELALRASPLPAPPITLDRDYTERSGWLNKLSHRKGVFGDKWQKRYFVLHRSWLYYFKKYGVRE